jgi:hypothetical protein
MIRRAVSARGLAVLPNVAGSWVTFTSITYVSLRSSTEPSLVLMACASGRSMRSTRPRLPAEGLVGVGGGQVVGRSSTVSVYAPVASA